MFVNYTNYMDYKFFTNGVRFNVTHYAKVVKVHPKYEMKKVINAPMFVGREILDITTSEIYTIKSVVKRFHNRGGSYLNFILENTLHKEIFFSDIDTEDEDAVTSTIEFERYYKIL